MCNSIKTHRFTLLNKKKFIPFLPRNGEVKSPFGIEINLCCMTYFNTITHPSLILRTPAKSYAPL